MQYSTIQYNAIVSKTMHGRGHALQYILLSRVVLDCIMLYCIVLYCIALYCIVLYCIALYCMFSYLHSKVFYELRHVQFCLTTHKRRP